MHETSYTSKTPCVGLCSTVYGDLVCRGCKRFSHEIIDWNRYDHEQRGLIWHRLEQLLSQIMTARIEIVSALQLRSALAARRMEFFEGQPLIFQAWRLLARTNTPTLAQCGLKLRPAYADLTLKQLREGIDQTFFSLSEAYYQRHAVMKNP